MVMVNSTFWKDKKVLVTGNTGFKGSWLSLWLHKMGADVYGIALEPNTQPDIFSVLNLKNITNTNICDIRNGNSLKKLIHSINPDIVFHLAAQPLVRLSYKEPVTTYETNVMGTVNVLESLR